MATEQKTDKRSIHVEVRVCADCPFDVTFDDGSERCTLTWHLPNGVNTTLSLDVLNEPPPPWCPLRTSTARVSLMSDCG